MVFECKNNAIEMLEIEKLKLFTYKEILHEFVIYL